MKAKHVNLLSNGCIQNFFVFKHCFNAMLYNIKKIWATWKIPASIFSAKKVLISGSKWHYGR